LLYVECLDTKSCLAFTPKVKVKKGICKKRTIHYRLFVIKIAANVIL